jgi:acetoacetate decarboxylase
MSKLALNAVSIRAGPGPTVTIGVQPFDKDRLTQLRSDGAGRYYFRKDRAGIDIVAVPLQPGLAAIGTQTRDIDLAREHWLVASLATETLLSTFVRLGRQVLRGQRPLRVISQRPANLLPEDAGLPQWLQRRLALDFETRTLRTGEAVQTVLVCSVRTRNIIDADCGTLLKHDIPLIGQYVAHRHVDHDPRVEDSFKLAGRVVRIEGGRLHLDDAGDRPRVLNVQDAYLEPRKENVTWCIQQLLRERADRVIERAETNAAKHLSGPERHELIRRTFDYLRAQPLELAPGVPLEIGPQISQSSNSWNLRTTTLSKPLLVFDPDGTRTDRWNERGLDQHGPYDRRHFTPKKLRIAVVCQAHCEGQVDEFLAKFLNGLPDIKTGSGEWVRTPYAQGFTRRFILDSAKTTVFTTRSTRASDYVEACRAALAAATNGGFEWDLAIVQIDQDFKELDDAQNPYYATKAIFLKHRVPVQEVTSETISFSNQQLVFALNNMSVATYAKIGGVPWLLKSQPRGAHELVIGIGSQELTTARLAAKRRIVGLTTVFSSDGNYLLDDMTAAVDYDGYSSALLESLKRSIERVRVDDAWRTSDEVRLIFHVFKEIADSEAEAVANVVQQLGLTQVKYAFLHIVDSHPFAVFDEASNGTRVRDGVKGAFAPERGLVIHLNDHEALLFFAGGRELKQARDGHPLPALLRLHRQSTFRDMTYLTRQAFDFACHSWRMFTPAPLPITIHYSELMARLLSGLRNVPNWDPDTMLGPVSRTRWFL